jgi:hypothetical protein
MPGYRETTWEVLNNCREYCNKSWVECVAGGRYPGHFATEVRQIATGTILPVADPAMG